MPVSTAGLWDAAIGLWTHLLLYRRVAFGLLGHVYTFSPAPGVVERPSAVARDELGRQLRLRWRLLREVQQRASTGAEVVVVLVGRPDAARGEELMGRHLGQGFRQQPAEAAMRRRVVEIALWRRRRLRGRRDVRR